VLVKALFVTVQTQEFNADKLVVDIQNSELDLDVVHGTALIASGDVELELIFVLGVL
jgi:hypothetical protein